MRLNLQFGWVAFSQLSNQNVIFKISYPSKRKVKKLFEPKVSRELP
jgi:hypothetical protein